MRSQPQPHPSDSHHPTTSTDDADTDEPSLGARDNWWGDDVQDTTDDPGGQPAAASSTYAAHGEGTEWGSHHSFTSGVDPAESIATEILRDYGDAEYVCGRTLTKPAWNGGRMRELFAYLAHINPDLRDDAEGWPVDGREQVMHREQSYQPLSDPALAPPWLPTAHCTDRRRYSPAGYTNWEGATWVEFAPLPAEQYETAVRLWLADRYQHRLSDQQVEAAVNIANSGKHDPEIASDVDALTPAVRAVREETRTDPDSDNPLTRMVES